jgi:hypothetical protein
MQDEDETGPVERAVREDVDQMDLTGPLCRSYAESAFNLARKLDSDAGMATAAVARELRETLRVLQEASGDDDGTAQLVAELSAPVGHGPAP